MPRTRQVQGLRAVAGDQDAEPGVLEIIARDLRDLRLIVDHQDRRHREAIMMLRRGRGAFPLLVRAPVPFVEHRWHVPRTVPAAMPPRTAPEEQLRDQEPEEDQEKGKEREESKPVMPRVRIPVRVPAGIPDRRRHLWAVRDSLREAVVISTVANPQRQQKREDGRTPSEIA